MTQHMPMALRTLAEKGPEKRIRLIRKRDIIYGSWRNLLKDAAQKPAVAARHGMPAIIEGKGGARVMVIMSPKNGALHDFAVFEKKSNAPLWHYRRALPGVPIPGAEPVYGRYWKTEGKRSTYLIVAPRVETGGLRGMAGLLSELTGQITGSAADHYGYRVVGHGTLVFFEGGKVASIHKSTKLGQEELSEVEKIIGNLVKAALPLLDTLSRLLGIGWIQDAYLKYIKQNHDDPVILRVFRLAAQHVKILFYRIIPAALDWQFD